MKKFNKFTAAFILVIMSINSTEGSPLESVKRNAVVLVDESASLDCAVNASVDIQWHHTTLAGKREYAYAGGRFFGSYRGRLRLEIDQSTGSYILVIPDVKSHDAGLYECSEEWSGYQINSTQLTVLDSSPVCHSNMNPDGFVGPNTCNLQQENMTFTCAVSFSGTPPQLTWRSTNSSKSLGNTLCQDHNNIKNCSLNLMSDPDYDGFLFVCETTMPRYNCSTEVIRVHYMLGENYTTDRKINEQISCMVESNQKLHYSWQLKQDGQEALLGTDKTLLIEKTGIHQCQVEYSIRNISCLSVVSVVNISVGATAEKAEGSNLALISLAAIVFFLISAIVVYAIYTKIIMGDERGFIVVINTSQPWKDDALSREMNDAADDKRSKLFRSLERHSISVVAARPDKGIQIVMRCRHKLAVKKFIKLFNSKDLERIFCDILKQLLEIEPTNSELFTVNISINEQYVALIEEFTGHKDWLKDKTRIIKVLQKPAFKRNDETEATETTRKGITYLIRKYCFKKKEEAINGHIELGDLPPHEVHEVERLRPEHLEYVGYDLPAVEVQVINQIPENEEEARLRSLIQSQKQKLQEIMDPEFGLLADLVTTGALTPAEKEDTDAKNTTFSKNEVILDLILNNGKHREFITGLQNSGQIHVVNWIEADGVYRDEFGLIWPLREKEMEFINSNCNYLGDTLDIDVGFLETLASLSVINQRHVSHLKSKRVGFERNECFLNILRRLSLQAYYYVTKCIRDSKQENLAKAFEDGGHPITKLIEDNWKEILKTNYADLLVQIDSNTSSGLEGALRKSIAFTAGLLKQIWGYKSIIDRNKKILDLLERGDLERFNAFRKALLDCGQKALVDKHLTFIKEHLKSPDNRYNEPLKESCRQKLQINWNDLVGDIQINQVIPHLKERSTLTDYQQRRLENLPDNSSKTIYLLRLLETGSQQHFDDFCESLKKSNQSNIVTKYLTPETVSTNPGSESTQQQN